MSQEDAPDQGQDAATGGFRQRALQPLAVTRYGDTGTPVAFLHGLFGHGRNWAAIGKALTSEHRVLLVDLPDHGASPWTDGFDYLQVADTVAATLAGDAPLAVVGHSMGGKVAMVLALRHPQLVERLVVVDIAPAEQRSTGEFERFIAGMRGMDLSTIQRRADADRMLRPAAANDTVRAFLLQNLRHEAEGWRWQVNLDGLARDLPAIGGWPEDRLAGLEPYQGPVLWLRGERSAYVGDEHVEVMSRWFPRVRRVTIKGAGHWVHSEQPAVFTEVVRRFLAGG